MEPGPGAIAVTAKHARPAGEPTRRARPAGSDRPPPRQPGRIWPSQRRDDVRCGRQGGRPQGLHIDPGGLPQRSCLTALRFISRPTFVPVPQFRSAACCGDVPGKRIRKTRWNAPQVVARGTRPLRRWIRRCVRSISRASPQSHASVRPPEIGGPSWRATAPSREPRCERERRRTGQLRDTQDSFETNRTRVSLTRPVVVSPTAGAQGGSRRPDSTGVEKQPREPRALGARQRLCFELWNESSSSS